MCRNPDGNTRHGFSAVARASTGDHHTISPQQGDRQVKSAYTGNRIGIDPDNFLPSHIAETCKAVSPGRLDVDLPVLIDEALLAAFP